jgi:peptidoglycan/xylan/chitin deacetylase (PgdA/CDA1 family)
MHAAGMSIQSHTHTHPFLSELTETQLREELRTAKAALDHGLGQDTDQLALPGGDPPAAHLAHLIREAGYRVVATSRWGVNPPSEGEGEPVWVRRCTVRGAPSEDWLRGVLAGDRWIAARRIVREAVLHRLRATLGPTRYALWRRRFLGAVAADGGS